MIDNCREIASSAKSKKSITANELQILNVCALTIRVIVDLKYKNILKNTYNLSK